MPSAALVRPALLAAAGSHPGLARENNEDRYHCDPRRGVFMVIDGVGGHAAGEKAAATALAMLRARLERETGGPADRVREAITLANNEIFRLAATEPAWAGMACVLTVALVRDGRVTVGHVGDTRLYAFRGGVLSKVTHDHSPVGTREDAGEIGELDAMRHPRRNEIYRDVGSEHHEPEDEDFIETIEFPFEADSALVLCTDGLSDMIPSATLAAVVSRHAADPTRVVERLIEAANEAGGKDNVTAVFVAGPRFSETAPRYAPADEPGPIASLRARLSGAAAAARRALLSRPALAAYGVLGGVLLAAALVLFTDAVPDRLLRLSPAAGWSRTWRVGPDAADVATIQEALARARPGDIVEVAPGTYDGPIDVPRDVNLVSQRWREAVLRGPAAEDPSRAAVRLAGSSRLAGFKIEGPGGVVTEGADQAVLEDLEVTGGGNAVTFGEGSRGVLRASYLHDNGQAAVVVSGRALPTLLHNVITGNGKPAAGARPADGNGAVPPAVVLEGGATAVFFGNIIAGNAHDEIRGLPADKQADVLRDNVIGLNPQRAAVPRPPAGRGGAASGRGSTATGRTGR